MQYVFKNMIKSYSRKLWQMRGQRRGDLWSDLVKIRNWTREFQPAQLSDLMDATELPNLTTAAEIINQQIANKKPILLFGDFDTDGISGVALLQIALQYLGAKTIPKLPSRSEGYGLKKSVYDKCKERGIELVITVDCGSSNAEEIAYGNQLGIKTIVTDHHTITTSPPAAAVVHPHLGDKTADYYHLTGAGVALFLAKYLLEQAQATALLPALLELAVLGTVADVGILRGQNRIITELGLRQLEQTQNPGIKALLEISKSTRVTAETIGFYLAPRLNAAGRLEHPHTALCLLLGNTEMALNLEELNNQRKELTKTALANLVIDTELAALVAVEPALGGGLTGLIAGQLCEQHAKPAIVITKNADTWVGSCRSPADFAVNLALEKLRQQGLVIKCGGHTQAAGFSIAEDKIAEFTREFIALTETQRGTIPPPPTTIFDCQINPNELTLQNAEQLLPAAPFGMGNPQPLFLLPKTKLTDYQVIGHTGSTLRGQLANTQAISFSLGKANEINWQQPHDFLINLDINTWRDKQSLQLKIVDVRPALA